MQCFIRKYRRRSRGVEVRSLRHVGQQLKSERELPVFHSREASATRRQTLLFVVLTLETPSNGAHVLHTSGYDHLPLPESIFEPGAVRFRSGTKDAFTAAYALPNFSVPLESSCGKNDIVMTNVDNEAWTVKAGVPELRKLLYSVMPFEESDEFAGLWKQLEDELQDRKVDCIVPMSGILATKKR
ncbi:hypothetical protein BST61_g3563 [Cercospora zeina]